MSECPKCGTILVWSAPRNPELARLQAENERLRDALREAERRYTLGHMNSSIIEPIRQALGEGK